METQHKDTFAMMTNRIVAQMEGETVPWLAAWKNGQLPENLATRKRYSGINLWWLNSLPYPTNYFLTFRQAQQLGASVRKGEKAHPVVYWFKPEPTEQAPKPEALLGYTMVFNISQCSGLPAEKVPPFITVADPVSIFEEIVETMPNRPEIRHIDSLSADYYIAEDCITLPPMDRYDDPLDYYVLLFQCMVNSTGARFRLNRREIAECRKCGDETFTMEELISIMGASYLLGFVGISAPVVVNIPDYCAKWAEVLKRDKRLIVRAGTHAQNAVEHILGLLPSNCISISLTQTHAV